MCDTDVVDNESISQVINLLNQPYIEGSKVRMMPDIHAGAGCTIGTTMTIKDKICPNLVGVDIGCGMETIRIKETHIEPQKLDKVIRAGVPSGFEIRTEAHRYANGIDLSELCCAKMVNIDRAYKSIGTLGGGNHFIEANKDDNGHIYIVVHSGSRHLGLEIANFYQEAAFKALTSYSKEEIEEVVNELKAAGRQKEIQAVLKGMKAKKPGVPKQLAYVEGELFEQYMSILTPGKTINLRMDGVDGETLLLMLDGKGVCVSAGSACRSHEAEPSHVLSAMGLSKDEARSSIRISFSKKNTADEAVRAAQILAGCISALRVREEKE